MTRYLLDTVPLTGYLKGAPGVVHLIDPWLVQREVNINLLGYGEVVEHLRRLQNGDLRQIQLRQLLEEFEPLSLDYAIMKRYADLRRQLRPPHGSGLIGDIDTLIAATALEHNLTLVTMDTDFQRVPALKLTLLPRKM